MIPYTEVKNLDVWKDWLKNWVNSGQYEIDISDSLINAYTYVSKAIGDPMASVIFDIDETMISEYSLMLKYDFGWNVQSIEEAQTATNFPAIKPVQDFYNYCIQNNINVFILSSKREDYLSFVLAELTYSNYKTPKQLILRPNNDIGSIADFKMRMRRKLIEVEGYKIICNIGDQEEDFYKGYAEHDIKIPNKFYAIGLER